MAKRPNRANVTSRKPVAKAAGTRPVKAKPKGKAGNSKPARAISSNHAKLQKPSASKASKAGKPIKAAVSKPKAIPPARKAHAPRVKPRPTVVAKTAPAPIQPSGPSSHELAMERFERGFQALQQREFRRAGELLNSLVGDFPDEKELHDRVRVYLAVCRRQAPSEPSSPRTFDERVYAATVTINRGAYDEGLSLLQALEREAPAHDHVHYMLAVVHTLRGRPSEAVPHLERAIELNEQNRYLASQDADLELLREYDGVAPLLETPAGGKRSALRSRSIR